MKTILLFASGSGSNVENIVHYFKEKNQSVQFHIFSNKKEAFVLQRAKNLGLPATVFTKEEMLNGTLTKRVQELAPDFIVLAGFLLKFPSDLIELYPNKIVNIHPALLPNYGGKGMYGMHVHQAVVANKESESGITIHYVNEHYDKGAVIFQKQVSIALVDTPEDVASKIHELEYEFFPKVIDDLLQKLN